MNYELEIAFDFKNSKEYFVRYEPIELTDSEKIPEKLKNKKLYVFEKVKPKAKNIGTFLLEFLNLDFKEKAFVIASIQLRVDDEKKEAAKIKKK